MANTATDGSEGASSTSNNVYVTHDEYGWVPGRILSSTDKHAVVLAKLPLDKDGEEHVEQELTVQLKNYDNNALPLQNVDTQGNLIEVKDMVDLSFLHEAAILYNLKHRHQQSIPYTRTGDIVIAVNPYQASLHSSHTYFTCKLTTCLLTNVRTLSSSAIFLQHQKSPCAVAERII